jgi:UV DNA damage repair endonuclease
MTQGLISTKQNKNTSPKTLSRSRFLELDKRQFKLGEETLSERIVYNLNLTNTIIEGCSEQGIGHYRLSPLLFPLLADKSLDLNLATIKGANKILNLIKKIGATALENDISLSVCPPILAATSSEGLASGNSDSIVKTVRQLDFYAHLFDLMGFPDDYSNPIHVYPHMTAKDATQGHLEGIVDRFYDGMVRCNDSVIKRLVVMNEQNSCWNCMNLFVYFHQYMGHKHRHIMPLSYDNFHDDSNPSTLQGNRVTTSQNIDAFAKTWPDDITPVFCWSDTNVDVPDYERDIVWESERKDFTVRLKPSKVVTNTKKATKKKAIQKKAQPKPSVKKILKKIEKAAPKSATFNHLYGQ